jgi:predicted aldo/keto reductase-like oxidoreductase
VHTPLEYDYAMVVLDVLEEYKAKGIIRNIGTSQHIHFEVLYRMVDTGRLDEILVARGYFPKGMVELVSQRNAEFREMAIARADELGMNITGMKSLCSNIFSADSVNVVPGYPDDKRELLPAAAIRWAFSDPRFHVYAIGVTRHSDIDENIATCSGDMSVTDEDRVLLAEYSTRVWGSDAVKKMEEPLKYADSPFYVEAPLRDLWRGVWGKDGPSGWKG